MTTALLQVDKVSLAYRRGGYRRVEALRDVSLELHAGEFGGVWADRSAGKTTLARIAAGLIPPDSGRITFDGRDLYAPDRGGRLHGRIGLAVRQDPAVDHVPVAEWIASTLMNNMRWRPAMERAHRALDRCGASATAGERWQDLSDAERGLVAIAQAVVRDPRLLIVDDPVAGLGLSRRSATLKLLRSFANEGMAVLMTAADLAETQGADRLWSLEHGRLDGPPARPSATVVQLRSAAP